MCNNGFAQRRAMQLELKAKFPQYSPELGYLRVDRPLNNADAIYSFDILKGNYPATNVERLLDKNDTFYATHVGFLLSAQDNNKRGKAVLQTFPFAGATSPFVTVTGTSVAGIEDLELIYNSEFKLTVGNKNYIAGISTREMRWVPQAQMNGTNPKNQIDSAYNGLVEVGKICFSGRDDIQVTLNLPTYTAGTLDWKAVTASTDNVLSFYALGVLVKGTAQATTVSQQEV
jgi:hypothetical protein